MSTMVGKKISFLRDAGAVKRYHTERILEPDTVAHHSANVALICTILDADRGSYRLLKAALLHDAAEKYTGDTPAPFKRVLREGGVLDESFEGKYLKDNDVWSPMLDAYEKNILKTADLLDLIFKCVDEIEMGNTKAYPILENGLQYLAALQWGQDIQEKVKECLRHVRERLYALGQMPARLEAPIIKILGLTSTGTLLPSMDSTTSKDK